MDEDYLRKFVNKIFAKRGYPPVKKFAPEFADGILFERLFNVMYDEKINCRLSSSVIFEDRLLNWSRINQQICFNYLQQKFYLVEPTMRTLAKGTNSDCIYKLIKVLINTQQSDYEQALAGDTTDILDVASQIETERSLFGERDRGLTDNGDGLDISRFTKGKKNLPGGKPREKDILIDMKKERANSPHNMSPSSPSRGGQTVEYDEGINFPRSAQFDFLLDLENPEPPSRESRRKNI